MSTIPEQTQFHATAQQHRARDAGELNSVNESGCCEGRVAKMLESQTAKLPSDTWLYAAGGSILLSLALQASGQKQKALFVGNWAPTMLLFGIYNKMVKQHGSD
ncbi:hypothetical protein LOC71_06960 [Rhodopirellula sp. JC740]|uniref:Uncharacterized protein n=1 Tax=Rhodopirellula halodulae TaxID=2894198 RepID=A0ABS8NF11_9BACT|nr:hypothetical protein [Rhodopirellula sp. JC740]MCC9642009.1 hypothetical protein [Rhodopirellula sp. JC740]